MILLDTCTLLWLAYKQEMLSEIALKIINDTALVCISAISGFEIGIKYKSRKLQLPIPPDEWLISTLNHHNIHTLALDIHIAVKATELPLIHKDPCDRFIIATAIINSIPVITKDERFAEYGIKVIN
ncbi:MAG: type II toxin-antitoxin system VapC family toxin [Spirochaetales bacterium]|nr:type II toxin-antitoxin system VapC family toxin [Spirochaetales bacterium]